MREGGRERGRGRRERGGEGGRERETERERQRERQASRLVGKERENRWGVKGGRKYERRMTFDLLEVVLVPLSMNLLLIVSLLVEGLYLFQFSVAQID